MSPDIEWGAPPPDGRQRRGEAQAFVAELRRRPGEWAKYPIPVSRQMGQTNRKMHPGTEWTARARPDGKCDLYGRWVGNGEAHS